MNITELKKRVAAIKELTEKYKYTDITKRCMAESTLEYWEAKLKDALDQKAYDEFIQDLTDLEEKS